MKICTYCKRELDLNDDLCPYCNGKPRTFFSYGKLWTTLIGVIPLFVMSLFGWATILFDDSFAREDMTVNPFTLRGRLGGIEDMFANSGAQLTELNSVMTAAGFMLTLLIISFLLLVLSLMNNRSGGRANLAYFGFGLHALVSALFIIGAMLINRTITQEFGEMIPAVITFAPFPFISFVYALVSMIFLVKKPAEINLHIRKKHGTLQEEDRLEDGG
jgi:hypothetical protein